MDIRTIAPALSVGGQITAADVSRLAHRGFRSIICNRPDGEGPDQPAFAEIAAAARAAGMQARHIPVAGQVSHSDAAAFGRAMEEMPKPVFAYCRSGMRSEALWSVSGAILARSEG
jgi:sulfide:quinone oxidoreductase